MPKIKVVHTQIRTRLRKANAPTRARAALVQPKKTVFRSRGPVTPNSSARSCTRRSSLTRSPPKNRVQHRGFEPAQQIRAQRNRLAPAFEAEVIGQELVQDRPQHRSPEQGGDAADDGEGLEILDFGFWIGGSACRGLMGRPHGFPDLYRHDDHGEDGEETPL